MDLNPHVEFSKNYEFKSEIKNATRYIDDALCVLISETDLTGEEIYKLFIDRIQDTHNYFLKPLEKTKALLNALKANDFREDIAPYFTTNESKKIDSFNSDYNTVASYLENESKENEDNKIKELKEKILDIDLEDCQFAEDQSHSIRVIGADAYKIVCLAFEQDQNIDIKKYPIDINLYNSLDNKTNLNCSAKSISNLWNNTIKNMLIDKAISNIFSLYSSYIKDTWKFDYKNELSYFVACITETEARTNFKSIFDIMYFCDQWIDKCKKEILILCNDIQDNFDPKIKSTVKLHIKTLTS